ncbi:MAG: metallophosphoesterase [Halobacteriales archaeon]
MSRGVIAVLSDTHREAGHGLSGAAARAVENADVLVHAGDFTTPAVYDAFETAVDRIEVVHGNRDDPELTARLPAKRVFEAGGVRIALVHGHDHGGTALSLLGRSEGADIVVFGHSHRPDLIEADGVTLLNPGSHTQPRGHRTAHATIEDEGEGERVSVRLRGADGSVIDAAHLD